MIIRSESTPIGSARVDDEQYLANEVSEVTILENQPIPKTEEEVQTIV
ncbi:hypothetical protein [Enterococcus sp. AZ170]